jgi:phosphohistidine phosphatase
MKACWHRSREFAVKTLALFRHAKSDWSDARARDFDRPLNARGQRGALAMGEHVRDSGRRFDRVIASPAVRVAETIEWASKAWNRVFPVEWDRRIYLASSATLMDLLRELPGDPGSVLIGHNPGLEDLIFDLVPDDGTSPLRDVVEAKFPPPPSPCWNSTWPLGRRGRGCARLVAAPARPRSALGPQLLG